MGCVLVMPTPRKEKFDSPGIEVIDYKTKGVGPCSGLFCAHAKNIPKGIFVNLTLHTHPGPAADKAVTLGKSLLQASLSSPIKRGFELHTSLGAPHLRFMWS